MPDPVQTLNGARRLLSLINKGGKAGAKANATAGAITQSAAQNALHDYYRNQMWHGAVEPLKEVTPSWYSKVFDATDLRQYLPEWARKAGDMLQPSDIGSTFQDAYDPKGRYAPATQFAVDVGNLGINTAMGGVKLGPAFTAHNILGRQINLDLDPTYHSPLKYNLPIVPTDNEMLTDTEREINQPIYAHNKGVPGRRQELDAALRDNEKQWDALHDYTRQRQDWILALIKDLQKRGYTAGQIKTIVKKEKAKQSPIAPGDILRAGVYNQGMQGQPNFNLMQSPGFMSLRPDTYTGLSKNGVKGSYYYNLPAFYVP